MAAWRCCASASAPRPSSSCRRPTDYIRREIIARVKAETGRDLIIGGGASFTVFPSLGLRLSGVSLSAPAGMGGEPLLKAANFDVGVRLLPLLRQEIVVDRLELNEPVFSLRVDADGRRSWDMAGVDLPVRFAARSAGACLATSSSARGRRRAERGRRAIDRRHPHHQRRRALQRRAQRRLGALRRAQRAILPRRHGPAAARQRQPRRRRRDVRVQEHVDDAAGYRRAAAGQAGADGHRHAAHLQLRRDGRRRPMAKARSPPARRRSPRWRIGGATICRRRPARARSPSRRTSTPPTRSVHLSEHRFESRQHDRQRHRRLRGARRVARRTSPPISKISGLERRRAAARRRHAGRPGQPAPPCRRRRR